MAFQALDLIRSQITRLHDLNLGNVYGELGNSMELIERIARGDSWSDIKEWCKEQGFDQDEDDWGVQED